MQLTNSPAKIPLPFATSGLKNAIPEASQIGITAGAASLTDGFPPLTRTPLASGGIPVAPGDMNGILFELSAVIRWANAGGGYAYDGTFVTDVNVGGYPKGARVMRSDGLGYWFNTSENNTTDPEGAGAVAAGWVPDFTTGATAVTMTSSSVTLTALQYGKPVIVISGTLTANLNLIFPNIIAQWIVINGTTGAFAITAKTAAGTGVNVGSVQSIVGDGANIKSVTVDVAQQPGEICYFARNTAPTGFLKANGALISRTAYAALFAAIGTTFGVGDGSTTFALPDLRGEFIRGWDDSRGVDSGRVFGSAQADDFKSHTHTTTSGSASNILAAGATQAPSFSLANATSATGGTETRPRNVALLACIKY